MRVISFFASCFPHSFHLTCFLFISVVFASLSFVLFIIIFIIIKFNSELFLLRTQAHINNMNRWRILKILTLILFVLFYLFLLVSFFYLFILVAFSVFKDCQFKHWRRIIFMKKKTQSQYIKEPNLFFSFYSRTEAGHSS